MIIKVKRGTKTQIENTSLQIGEPAFATDTNELYIGTGTGKIKLASFDSNKNFQFDYATGRTLPSSGLSLFLKRTGSLLLWALTQHNSLFALQSAMFTKQIGFWLPAGNSTTVYALGLAITTAGTATARNVATTNFASQLRRIGYSTGTSSGTGAGIRGSYLQWWRGNASGLGGFLMATRFLISAITTNGRWFVGMAGTTSLLSNANPSTFTNIVGIGIDSGQTTIRVLYNDASGTASSIDLGSNFPANNTSAVYELYLYTPSNGDRFYYYIRRLDVFYEVSGELTTDIPANTQLLAPHLWINNGSDSSANIIDICWLYMETEY